MAENLGLLYDKDTNEKVSRLDTDYTTALATTLSTDIDATISSRATQAQILSDATPFAGANVDATISSRATQAQILSDATPFAGADIGSIKTAVDTTIPGDITSAVSSIKGSGPHDITEVYNLVAGSSNPFRVTTYGVLTGSPVSYVDSTWVDIYSSGTLTKDTEITGILITNSGNLTGDVFRITLSDGSTKLFPYGDSDTIGAKSGKLQEFQFPVRVPDGMGFKVQVNCTANNSRTATLTELDVIEHG